MGKYNFDEIIDRRGTSCNKWEYNVPEDVVPMWVADMDFAAAPEIREAMQKRLDHPVYGIATLSLSQLSIYFFTKGNKRVLSLWNTIFVISVGVIVWKREFEINESTSIRMPE